MLKTKSMLLYMDEKVHEKMKVLAKKQGLSLNDFVNKILADYLNKSCNDFTVSVTHAES